MIFVTVIVCTAYFFSCY